MVERKRLNQVRCNLLGSCIATMGRRVGSEAGGAGDGSRSSTGGPSELSAEEKLRLAAFRQEQEAFAAPTAVRGGSSLPGSPATAPLNDALQQFGSLASLLGAGKGTGDPYASANSLVPASARSQANSDYDQQNEQARKQLFHRSHARRHRR